MIFFLIIKKNNNIMIKKYIHINLSRIDSLAKKGEQLQ